MFKKELIDLILAGRKTMTSRDRRALPKKNAY